MVRLVLGTLVIAALAGCGDKVDPEKKKICEQAADRYVACVKEIMGPEMAAQADSKRDIAACAKDDRTVKAYQVCMPKDGCDAFMDCVMDIAMGQMPE